MSIHSEPTECRPRAGHRTQCVDSDVHPMPRQGELVGSTSPSRGAASISPTTLSATRSTTTRPITRTRTRCASTRSRPTASSRRDPDMALRQLVMSPARTSRYSRPTRGEPTQRSSHLPRPRWLALTSAANNWQALAWSICVAIEPRRSGSRDREWAEHPTWRKLLIEAGPCRG